MKRKISNRRDLIVAWAARKMECNKIDRHKIYAWALGRLINCPKEQDKLTEIYLQLQESK